MLKMGLPYRKGRQGHSSHRDFHISQLRKKFTFFIKLNQISIQNDSVMATVDSLKFIDS